MEKKKGDESRKRKRNKQREEKPAGIENIKAYKRPVPKVDLKKIKDKKLKSSLKKKVSSPTYADCSGAVCPWPRFIVTGIGQRRRDSGCTTRSLALHYGAALGSDCGCCRLWQAWTEPC